MVKTDEVGVGEGERSAVGRGERPDLSPAAVEEEDIQARHTTSLKESLEKTSSLRSSVLINNSRTDFSLIFV